MKKLIIAVFLVPFLLNPNQTKAQNAVLKINFLSLVVKTFNVSFEKVLDTDNSFQLGVFYTGVAISDTDLTGIGITPEYRFYLSDTDAPDGVYVAPYLRYSNFNLENKFTASEATLSSFGGGLVIGRQWLFKEKITFDIFLGPTYSTSTIKLKQGFDSFDVGSFDGFGIRIGLTLGIAF